MPVCWRLGGWRSSEISPKLPDATAALANRLKLALPPRATGRLRVEVLQSGPLVGVPVQVRACGPDIAEIRLFGDQVKALTRVRVAAG